MQLQHNVGNDATCAYLQRQTTAAAQADPIDSAIAEARRRYPTLLVDLEHTTLRGVVSADRTVVRVTGGATATFPTVVYRGRAGYYAFQWDARGDFGDRVIDLTTGTRPAAADFPLVHQVAGERDLQKLRANRIGVFWVQVTVTGPPTRRAPRPDQLQLPLPAVYEVDDATARRVIETEGSRPITVLGLTGGTFEPRLAYGRPLDFTYLTHTGTHMLVARTLVGRPFHYLVPVGHVQNFLRFHAIEYAGLASAHWVPISQLVMDVGIGFLPVIGPLYALAQAGVAARSAYLNWERMSGWERGLVGATILLSAVPALRGGYRLMQGARAYRSGVQALMNAGLPAADARRLMIVGGVFGSDRATLSVVDTLGDALRRGERLTFAQTRQLEGVFRQMLNRLPVAERTAIAASFATINVRTAAEFFSGVTLTERHLAGLRRLAPDTLAALRTGARDQEYLLRQAALWAASSEEVAAGIDALQRVTRKSHLAQVVGELGEDLLREVGSAGGQIPANLVAFARRASGAMDAARRLILGKPGVPGLRQLLMAAEPTSLPAGAVAVRQQFPKVFLTAGQAAALARLSPTTRQALLSAGAGELREIAASAAQSAAAVRTLDRLATELSAAGGEAHLAGLAHRLGRGLLDAVDTAGIGLRTDLMAAVARQRGTAKAADVLLHGFVPRGGSRVPGLLDAIAGRLTTATGAERTLAAVELPYLQGELFARWALAQPEALRSMSPSLADGVAAIVRARGGDAQQMISRIYSAVAGKHEEAVSILVTLGDAERIYGRNINLAPVIADLAAGGEKAMGTTFTLTFVTHRRFAAIAGFEYEVTVGSRRRVYDLVADGLFFEFKNWQGFAGRPAAQAADEFARDVILHVADGFARLRWVISRDAIGSYPAIQSMMRGVLSRREVRIALRQQKISVPEATARLNRALADKLILLF